MTNDWPWLPPLKDWENTCSTLPMWARIVGKVRPMRFAGHHPQLGLPFMRTPVPPAGFDKYPVQPATAYFHRQLGEFILPSEAVRTAENPAHTLLSFLQATYEAAAHLASGLALGWSAKGNERMTQRPRIAFHAAGDENMKPFPNIPDAEGAPS